MKNLEDKDLRYFLINYQKIHSHHVQSRKRFGMMEGGSDFIIRPATQRDVPSINAILAHYALNTVMTFATEAQPDSVLSAKLDNIMLENHLPFFVATTRSLPSTSVSHDATPDFSGEVIGICYVSPYKPQRLAYSHTGELSLFIHHDHQGRGIGSALLRTVLTATHGTRIRELLSVMAVDEKGKGNGLALRDYYKRWGFREVGTLEKVGFKFDRW
jgi:phosphinothricin acetyltransferase